MTNNGQAVSVVSFFKILCAFIIINIIHFIISCIIIKHCILQTLPPDTGLTQPPHSLHVACPISLTALKNTQQHCHTCHSALSSTLCEHIFCACSKWSPWHAILGDGTVHTQHNYDVAGDSTVQRATWLSAMFWTLWEHCKNATLVWQGFYVQEYS